METTYKTIQAKRAIDFKEKGSKFIGLIAQCTDLDEVNEQLSKWKGEFPKASHLCYAYNIGIQNAQMRANDDGEPSNSAGMPILGQIQAFDLTNTLIGVIRYYGGTNLGVGGLMQAYKNAAKMVIEVNEIIEKEITETVRVYFSAAEMPFVMNDLKQMNLYFSNQQFNACCALDIALPLSQKFAFFQKMEMHESLTFEFLA